jgi:hypothetical protein
METHVLRGTHTFRFPHQFPGGLSPAAKLSYLGSFSSWLKVERALRILSRTFLTELYCGVFDDSEGMAHDMLKR